MQLLKQLQSRFSPRVQNSTANNGYRSRRVHHCVRAATGQFTKEADSPASPTTWTRIVKKLKEDQVECISSDQFVTIKDSGVQVIDVRPTKEYESGFINGSVNIPLYDLIVGWTPLKMMQRASYAAFGVFDGTELNESFFEGNGEVHDYRNFERLEVENVLNPDDGVVLVCGIGETYGRVDNKQNLLPSRSLIAAHQLSSNGYKKIKVLGPGTKGWEAEGRYPPHNDMNECHGYKGHVYGGGLIMTSRLFFVNLNRSHSHRHVVIFRESFGTK